MKYFKIAVVVGVVIIFFVVIGVILFMQFLFGLFTHFESPIDFVRNINETKVEESITKVKEAIPAEVTTIVEQTKAKIAPYDSILKEAEGVMLKVTETVERFEKLIP